MKTKLLFALLILPLFGFTQINLLFDSSETGGLNPAQGNPDNAIVFGSDLYFTTSYTNLNSKVYKTNGTNSGTLAIKHGTNASDFLVTLNPDWNIYDDGTGDLRLAFTCDQQVSSSSFSTQKLATSAMMGDFSVLGSTGQVTQGQLENINDRLYFISSGINLFRLNLSGTIVNLDSFGSLTKLFEFNNMLFMTADDGDDAGNELYVYDPVTNVTSLVADINQVLTGDFANPNQTFGSDPNDFFEANGKLYFTADTGFGRQLCSYDGSSVVFIGNTDDAEEMEVLTSGANTFIVLSANVSGTKRIVRVNTNNDTTTLLSVSISDPTEMISFNGFVYFSAIGSNGRELYRTDATSGGTGLVLDINAAPSGNSNPSNFLEYNTELYFSANDGTNGRELWKVDNANQVSLVEDFNPGSDSFDPKPISVFNNRLYINGLKAGTSERELYIYTDPSIQTFVPDDNFEQYLISQGFDTVLDDYVPTGNISNLTTLNLINTGISDFTGIEDFTSLQILTSSGNDESTLDLSQNTSLEEVTVFLDFNLTNLILTPTGNPNLRVVTFAANQLSSLDLSGFTTLELISCQGSGSLINLNVEDCTMSNLQVDLSNMSALTSINLTNATAVKEIYIQGTSSASVPITSIDTSFLTDLTDFVCIDCELQDLDLSTNTLLDRVIVSNNSQLTALNVKNSNNSILTSFNSIGTNLPCVEVDDEVAANAGTGVYSSWQKDTSTLYSENCASLSDEDMENVIEISLYPNPTSSLFKIANISQEDVEVAIYDVTGKRVVLFDKRQESYSTKGLDVGVYFVKVKLGKRIATLKLLKN